MCTVMLFSVVSFSMSGELAELLRTAPRAGPSCSRTAPARVFGPRPPSPNDVEETSRGSRLPILFVPLLLVAGFGLTHAGNSGRAVDEPRCSEACVASAVYAD